MKFCLALLGCVLAASVCHSLVILPDELPQLNAPMQCASGLPKDGTFENGALGSDWRIGALRSGKAISPADVMFGAGFTSIPPAWRIGQESSAHSIRLPGNGVVFQYLGDSLSYAHYRLKGCARVHGETPCRIEVRNSENELVDFLEFEPSKNLTQSCSSSSSSSSSSSEQCVQECTAGSTFSRITVRYTGQKTIPVLIRMAGAQDGMTVEMTPGQELNITQDLFAGMDMGNSTSNSTGGSGNGLPEFIELVSNWNAPGEVIDVISTNCSAPTVWPGMRFGDLRNFVLARADDENMMPLCPVSEIADAWAPCACESESVEERCLLSDKGFVASPHDSDFYIGLVSRDCSCSFDNVCLELVNGDEGYFGLDWLLTRNSTTA